MQTLIAEVIVCSIGDGREKAAQTSGCRYLFLGSEGSEHHFATLVLLPFIRTHVAADAIILFVGARLAALIGLQQMTISVSAAVRVASVDCWATVEQSLGLSRPSVVPQ